MPSSTQRKKRNSLSPYLYFFIPIAFAFGLLSGYLLWGSGNPESPSAPTEITRVNVSTEGDPSIGPVDAPVTIVEFSDYQCPYCTAWYRQTLSKILTTYPNQIRFVYRDLPIPSHSEAVPAAEAANCAGEQGAYWKFHDALFSDQYPLGRTAYEQYAQDLGLDLEGFKACLDDHRYQVEVKEDAAEAARLGLNATPSFVINGRIVIGALPFESFKAIIDEELAAQP